jgi:asparagine synthase (glutamine-hydrolysing)
VERAGLRVFHAGARAGSSGAHVLHGGAGVVLGRLFAHDAAASEMLDAGETAAIVGSGGRRLIERYWGRYVAVVHDAPGRQTWVLRDPTAGLPCLHLRFQGVEVFFADVEDALALGLGPFSIDMDYVAAHLCYQILESRVSGLREVRRAHGARFVLGSAACRGGRSAGGRRGGGRAAAAGRAPLRAGLGRRA